MNKDQLLSLTLRQLRQEASKLSVPLYSRKTKAVLVDLILKYQEKSTNKTNTVVPQSQAGKTSESNSFKSSEEVKTNVVFLPRDPDWAYVFWQISDADRDKAQSLGANKLCLRLFDATGSEGINLNHQAYYFDVNLNQEVSSLINYDINSVGAGISFGLERIFHLIDDNDLFPDHIKTTNDVLVINFGKEYIHKILPILNDIFKIKSSQETLTLIKDELIDDKSSDLAYRELKELYDLLCINSDDIINFSFDLNLARGLDYYTGAIFEVINLSNQD